MFAYNGQPSAMLLNPYDESGAIGASAMRPGYGPSAPAMPVDKDGQGRMPPPTGQLAVGRNPEPGLDLRGTRSPQGMFASPAPQRPMLPDMMGPINDALAENQRVGDEKGHNGLFPGKDWKTVVGKILPAAINGYLAGMGNPAGIAGLNQMHEQRMMEAKTAALIEEERRKALLPQQVGKSLVQPDGIGGYQTLYSEPTDAERYAADLGLQPGSDEWANAIREYRAPAWSPWALEGKEHLEGVRYGHRDRLQDDRYGGGDRAERTSS